MTPEALMDAAKAAMLQAYAPYSHYQVGAALECEDGTVYIGCNIENASYGVTNCAERTALFKAVSEGKRSFRQIAVTGGMHGCITDFAFPCGICRQALSEFCGSSFAIHLYNGNEYKTFTLGELLPASFGACSMNRV